MPTHLGQNFLTDESIAKKIVDSAGISPNDNVLEIGPGKGMLTRYLAEKAERVLAIEIDSEVCKICDSKIYKLGLSDKVNFLESDILKINLPKLIEKNDFLNYKVVANLPYYITSKIIRLFLETKYPPSVMILMVQKEVGERIVALDGKESILSISVKFYADPEILFGVSRENFEPSPEVDSVVIRLTKKSQLSEVYPAKSPTHGRGAQEAQFNRARFFSLVRAGFSAKRKMLINNLKGLGCPRVELLDIFKKSGLEPGVRAEKLGVEDWVKLYEIMSNLKCQKSNPHVRCKKF